MTKLLHTLTLSSLLAVAAATPADALADGIKRLGENSPLVPPFCETFDNFRQSMEHDDFPRYFQTIDADGEGRSWGLYNYPAIPYGRCAYMLYPIEAKEADDWLITRAIRLKEGEYYCVNLDAALYLEGSEETPQKFEVCIGNFNDAEGMDQVVIPVTDIYRKQFTHCQGWFTPEFTGIYYIGIHGVSPRYTNYYNYLFIDNISIEKGRPGDSPREVTDVIFRNDPMDAKGTAVMVDCTLPTLDLSGTPLSGIGSVTLWCDGVMVDRIENPAPGASVTLADDSGEAGTYSYMISVEGADGTEGGTYRQLYQSGLSTPLAPQLISCSETADNSIHIVWSAPEGDMAGHKIDPSLFRYNVYEYTEEGSELVAENISATEYVFEPLMPHGATQTLALAGVTAVLNGEESTPSVSDYVAVGEPEPLPYLNSFTLDDYYRHTLAVEVKENVTWQLLDDFSSPKAQDGDNGYLCMVGNAPDQECEIQTGKIDLSNAEHPVLTFFTYVYGDDENEIQISLIDAATGKHIEESRQTVYLYDYYGEGWRKVRYELPGKVGVVRLGINGIIRSHGYIPIDNLQLRDVDEVDLSVDAVRVPSSCEAGETVNFNVDVVNNGYGISGEYTVSLLSGENVVAGVTGTGIGSGEKREVAIPYRMNASYAADNIFTVEVVCAGDSDESNDRSLPVNLICMPSGHPEVTDLRVENGDAAQGSLLRLVWSEPDLSNAAPWSMTEDFEDYDQFATSLQGFTMVDEDKALVGGFTNFDFPLTDTQQAFWVLQCLGNFTFCEPWSGDNVLMAMYSRDAEGRYSVANSDWLISPELYGGAQFVSFYARALHTEYGYESLQVYASSSGRDLEDFELMLDIPTVDENWKEYLVRVPAGTKYFAIRYNSDDRYMVFIDDIRFIPEGESRKLSLTGYNVYRNCELLNTTPVKATEFETPFMQHGDTYVVTAVYDKGESGRSNAVTVGDASADMITADGPAAEWYTISGLRLSEPPAVPGIYIKRAGSRTVKVIK